MTTLLSGNQELVTDVDLLVIMMMLMITEV